MKKMFKNIIKIGTISSLPLVAIATTVSLANPNVKEYISIKIDGKNLIFKNAKEATDYVLRNKINAEQKVMVGDSRYLSKNNGLIDPNSLFEYRADNQHISPAYKMMNGKYTRSRDEALNSYLGRSHLVGQYFDGINYHDGNSIGLKEAKDAILSRQKEDVVPYYDVKLKEDKKIRINPFNKEDITHLQKEAFNIYKENKNFKYVTSTYLLPTNNKDKIAVSPENPTKGLQISDLFSFPAMTKEFIRNYIKFNFTIDLKEESPYFFSSRTTETKQTSKSKDTPITPTMKLEKKKISINEISYKYFQNHQEEFMAFLKHKNFWDYFVKNYANYGLYKASTWANVKKGKTVFGKRINIVNADPHAHVSYSGYDVTINSDKGTYKRWQTHAKLSWTLNSKKMFEDFKEIIIGEINKTKYNIEDNLKKKIINKFKIKTTEQTSNYKLKSLYSGDMKTSSGKTSSSPSKPDEFYDLECLKGDIDKRLEKLKELKIETPNDIFNGFSKLLLVNNTPIAVIDQHDNISDSNVYNKIKRTMIEPKNKRTMNEPKKFVYKYSSKNDLLASIKLNKSGNDFKLKYLFASSSKDEPVSLNVTDLNDIFANKEYSKKKPLLFKNSSMESFEPINLVKILTDKIGTPSIWKIYSTEFFYNDKTINNRKKEINETFFQPALIYVIYNDNDQIIGAFKSINKNIRFDSKETIKHNAKALLSKYIKKDTHVFFIRDKNGEWTKTPISNKIITVYDLGWENKRYMFRYFENIKHFISEWVKNNARKFVVKG